MSALAQIAQSMSEAKLLATIHTLPLDQLRLLHDEVGAPDCNCPIKMLPCGCAGRKEAIRVELKGLRSELKSTRHEWGRAQLLAEIARKKLELVEECQCPVRFESCEHTLDRQGKWLWNGAAEKAALMILADDPEEYDSPPLPDRATTVIQREALAQIMAERSADSRALRHPGDAKKFATERYEEVGIKGQDRRSNGTDVPGEMVSARHDHEDDSVPDDSLASDLAAWRQKPWWSAARARLGPAAAAQETIIAGRIGVHHLRSMAS